MFVGGNRGSHQSKFRVISFVTLCIIIIIFLASSSRHIPDLKIEEVKDLETPVPKTTHKPEKEPVKKQPLSKSVTVPIERPLRDPTWTHPIPRILHQIHKSEDAVLPADKMLRDKCKELHPGWKFEFWDDDRIENLIKEKYAWYYPTWKSFTPFIKRVDTSRYILMHAYGGVYLDSDVECVKNLEGLIKPLPPGAYSGAFPEPMFVMSEPGNKFWIHMMNRINNTRNKDTWDNTGPVGLNEAFIDWVEEHGSGVILTWQKAESVVTDDKICDNGGWSYSPWYMFEKIKDGTRKPWPESTRPITPDMKIGFICNELMDPAACSSGALSSCINSFCAQKWPHSFTVHHCRSTWRPKVGDMP